MFTPPASPAPSRMLQVALDPSPPPSDSDEEGSQYLLVPRTLPVRCSSLPSELRTTKLSSAEQHASSLAAKHRTARRTRWTILLVPLVLVLITASTRYVSHPALLDMFSADRPSADFPTTLAEWRPHKRHASPDGGSATISLATPTSSGASSGATSATPATSSGSQTIPTVPSTPPTLPTPFPQPLDQTFSRNFSTQGCLDFFNNMTQSTSFRSCRAFSLLSVQSTEFIQAQDNITYLNDLVWGTCNTNTSENQCISNMGWFVETLEDVCSDDLKANNAVVTQTRDGLLAYSLMRDVGCLEDQTTNAYCYLEAVHHAADSYFYTLPFGYQYPSTASPSCSACTKSIMNLYSASNLTALAEVYNPAAAVANKACGTGFVTITSGNLSSAAGHAALPPVALLLSLLGLLAMWTS